MLVASVPSYNQHIERFIEAEDPESGIEAEYHPKKEAEYCWRARRLMAVEHLSSFGSMSDGDLSKGIIAVVAKSKFDPSAVAVSVVDLLNIVDDDDDDEHVYGGDSSQQIKGHKQLKHSEEGQGLKDEVEMSLESNEIEVHVKSDQEEVEGEEGESKSGKNDNEEGDEDEDGVAGIHSENDSLTSIEVQAEIAEAVVSGPSEKKRKLAQDQ